MQTRLYKQDVGLSKPQTVTPVSLYTSIANNPETNAENLMEFVVDFLQHSNFEAKFNAGHSLETVEENSIIP